MSNKRSINRFQLDGTVDSEIKCDFESDTLKVVSFMLKTEDDYKDQNTGEIKTTSSSHRVTAYNDLADICLGSIKSGQHVFVEGRIRNKNIGQKEQDKWIKEFTIKYIGF